MMDQIKSLQYLYFIWYILKSGAAVSFLNVSIYNILEITFFENI